MAVDPFVVCMDPSAFSALVGALALVVMGAAGVAGAVGALVATRRPAPPPPVPNPMPQPIAPPNFYL